MSKKNAGRDPRVVIVGSGIGGLGMAINLVKRGLGNVVVLEQGADLGGVWRDNTYPGAACDVPSTLYSYSFERQTGFQKRYPGQPDILEYLRRTAAKHGVLDKIRYGSKVVSAAFDEDTAKWVVTTEDGHVETADVFIPAVGTLARPKMPDLVGVDDFTGPAFHSARWRHDLDLTGKRVAVIGTGASALQFVPHLQKQVAELTVYQRSAPYVMPLHNYTYDKGFKRFLGTRAMRLADRFGFWYIMELGQQIFSKWRKLSFVMSGPALKQLKEQVPDPELRAKLTPDHEVGCKRVLFSSAWYPALSQPNVEVVTDRIAKVTENGVEAADGTVREADVIVYGTGFKTDDILGHVSITGVGGEVLSEQWKAGAEAYLGITVKRFPNMFLVYGPNTDLGSGSIPYMLESQMTYIAKAVRRLADMPERTTFQLRDEVHDSYQEWIETSFRDTAWTAGCSNWYTNDQGRVVTNWPLRSWRYRRRTSSFDPKPYLIGSGARAGATSAR